MNFTLQKRITAVLFSVLFLVAYQPAAGDQVSAEIDRSSIYVDETAKLVITAEGQSLMGYQPQLGAVEQDFEIIGQSNQTNVRVDNGQTHVSQSWVVEIRPRRLGTLTIPPIAVGGLTTNALEIQVGEYQPQIPSTDDDVFVEVEVIPENPYVQSQVTIVTRLFYALDIVRGEVKEPDIAFGKIEKLGSDRRYTAEQGGRKYSVAEFRHVTFAQNSGEFEIPPIDFNGIVSTVNNATLQRDHSRIRVSSRPLKVVVRPKPQSYSGSTWLPAKNLQITDSWQGSIPDFEAGKSEPRTITIDAVGLRSTHLSTPEYVGNDTVRVYSTNPQMSDGLSNGLVVAKRVEEFVVIPKNAGKVEVPAFEVVWWDVDADEERVARLPAVTNAQVLPLVQGDSVSAQSEFGGLTDSLIRTSSGADSIWKWVSAAVLAIWLVTMGFWYVSWRKWRNQPLTQRIDEQLDDRDAQALHKRRRQIKKACMDNDISAASRHLLAWAKIRWKEDSPANLLELANVLGSGELTDELTAMDESIYSPRTENWQGARFWRVFAKVNRVAKSKRQKRFGLFAFGDKQTVLEDLWPESSIDEAK